jgi:hypothetical protein
VALPILSAAALCGETALVDNGLVRGFQSKNWGWWYFSIGSGFLLLAIAHLLQGAGLVAIVLRIAVAAGFALLGWMQLRFGR